MTVALLLCCPLSSNHPWRKFSSDTSLPLSELDFTNVLFVAATDAEPNHVVLSMVIGLSSVAEVY